MWLLAQGGAEGVEAFAHRRILVCGWGLRQFDTLRPAR